MRFRVTPNQDVAAEIKRVDRRALIELMRRAATRMADGDLDEHIERAVVWEGHSEEFSRWLVREVRASFDAFNWNSPKTTLELAARAASRLAVVVVLFLLGQVLLADRDSTATLLLVGPIMFAAFVYGLGFLVAGARLLNRVLGRDKEEDSGEPPESR